jgi:hypothetical protein
MCIGSGIVRSRPLVEAPTAAPLLNAGPLLSGLPGIYNRAYYEVEARDGTVWPVGVVPELTKKALRI